MKSIKDTTVCETIINKSRFIGVLCKVANKDDVDSTLSYYKNIYKNATHYCYAYVIDGYSKCSDDGEPSGTAGVPILNILNKNELNYVLCIVIRYFGGIKLGAGGLVRAYSNCARDVVGNSEVINLTEGYFVSIEFDYDNIKVIDEILRGVCVSKYFDEKIVYDFKIDLDAFMKIENVLNKYVVIIKKESTLV